jgi:hypothetical protein
MKILSATSSFLEVSHLHAEVPGMRAEQGDRQPIIDAQDVYVVFTCIEMGDGPETVNQISDRIFQQWLPVRAKYPTIVVVPFGHLSEIAQPDIEKITPLVLKLARSLIKKGAQVVSVPPNTANILFAKWLFFDNGNSIRFSSSDRGLSTLLKDILSVYGAEQTLSTLATLITRKEDPQ